MFRTESTRGPAIDTVFLTRSRRPSPRRVSSPSIGFSLLLIAALMGALASHPVLGATFTRSDANADGATDVSDALTVLLFLFGGAPAELPCHDAADADDSGTLDLTDAVFLLDYLFADGASPPAPLQACGIDPTEDGLGCESFPPCAIVDGGITEVPGDPAGDAAELVPVIEYEPDLARFSTEGVPGLGASTRDAAVMLRTGVTVGELNDLLAREGASIVGSAPKVETIGNALLVLRFPTSSPLELLDLTDRLESDPVVEVAAPDALVGSEIITDDEKAVTGVTTARCSPHGVVGASGDWKWELPDGGNWGLESARVPQMWNCGTSMPVFSDPVVTGVVDGGVAHHDDVEIRSAPGNPARGPAPDHGLHVAGIIGVDPTLSGHELKDLILKPGGWVNAFTSVLEIDELRGDYRVLKLLLDVDDGSPDGSERVTVPAAVLARDRSFAFVVGPDDTIAHGAESSATIEGAENANGDVDGNGGMGDGVIDMSDFRRWRDWLYVGQGSHALNGGSTSLKRNDLNLDGWIQEDPTRERTLHPRGDFNGDGKLTEWDDKVVGGRLKDRRDRRLPPPDRRRQR